MGQPVEIRLLGDFSVTTGDRVVTASDFERRSGAELVQLLALAPNRRLHRERVIDALWPDAPLKSATNQFHKAASYARSGLGDRTAIIVRDEHVHLYPEFGSTGGEPPWIDLIVVETVNTDDPDSVTEAIAAYRGPLLPDLPYAEWVADRRRSVEADHIRLLAAAERWDEIVAIDPLHDRATIELMRRDLDRGDRAAVVRRFDELTAGLAEELGLEPSSEAVDIRNRAVHQSLTDVSGTDDDEAGYPIGAARRRPSRPFTAGRRAEIERITAELERSRLVTLVGPGGIGKTHLADVVAEGETVRSRSDGVAYCRFGRVDDRIGAGQEVLAALDARRQTDSTVLESIVRTIGDTSMILVFDNCEHIVGPVGALARELLARCRSLTILATSRAPLGLDVEQVVPLLALSRDDAATLFVTEARRHGSTVEADDPLIDRICRRVDDLPLAVRLAAARTRSLGLATLAEALDESLDLVGDDIAAGGTYERTLRQAVAWSIDSLTDELRSTLVGLSVFADRFSLDDARAVLDPDLRQITILDHLDELVERSLVTAAHTDRGSRFRLLESIRFVARERGLSSDVRLRHLTHVRSRVEAAEQQLSVDSGEALATYREIWSDLRAAVVDAVVELDRPDQARAIIAASATYANTVLQFDVIDWCELTLNTDDPVTDLVHARAMAAWSTLLTHRNEMAETAAITEMAAAENPDEPMVLYARAWIPWSDGDLPEARALLDELVASPDVPPTIEAGALTLQSVLLWAQGADVAPCAHRVGVLAPGRGPLFEAQARITRAIAGIWTEPAEAFADLDVALELTDDYELMTLGALVRATRAVALSVTAELPDALAAIRANLEWTRRNGVWSFAMAGLGTAAMVLDRAERADLAVTIVSARVANGFVAGFNAEFINDVVARARAEHPDEFDLWWDSGRRLDHRAATDLGIAAIDGLLSN